MNTMQDSVARLGGSWRHSFEEDEPGVQVFRPSASFPFPPARMPRASISFGENGAMTQRVAGPDDRLRDGATYVPAGRGRFVHGSGAQERVLEVIEVTPERLRLRVL